MLWLTIVFMAMFTLTALGIAYIIREIYRDGYR